MLPIASRDATKSGSATSLIRIYRWTRLNEQDVIAEPDFRQFPLRDGDTIL